MKKQKLSNPGFILLEAIVGVALFMIIVTLVLYSMVHITRQNLSVQGRHKTLCAVLYGIEHAKQQGAMELFFDKATHVVIQKNNHIVMPYNHPSVNWYTITARNGIESTTLYCAGLVYV